MTLRTITLDVPPDGIYIDTINAYIDGTGQALRDVHEENGECWTRGCVIHHPSDHVMRRFPTHWRGDRGIMERICEHGIGHPDVDQMSFLQSLADAGRVTQAYVDAEGVHGCDGCCA